MTAPAYWQLSGTVFDETLEYSGQIIKVSDYDKPAGLGVVITKRGNAEVLAGNQMRYDFTAANSLSAIPTQAGETVTDVYFDFVGKYQGTWQTAQGTWTTVIRKLTSSTPLPKTGY